MFSLPPGREEIITSNPMKPLHRLAGKRDSAPAAQRGKPSGRMPAPGA
jgi:hypothetical protein